MIFMDHFISLFPIIMIMLELSIQLFIYHSVQQLNYLNKVEVQVCKRLKIIQLHCNIKKRKRKEEDNLKRLK